MFNSKKEDKQVEFFSDSSEMFTKPKKEKLRLAKIALSLSYENMLIIAIGLIMLLIVCYSLGVEKGRQLAQKKQQEPATFEKLVDTSKVKQEQKVKKEPAKSAPEKRIRTKVAKAASESETYIQVASFRTSKYAQKEMTRLKNKGYKPFATTWGNYKVVCVGGYQNRNQASKDLKQLKELYADCILRNR